MAIGRNTLSLSKKTRIPRLNIIGVGKVALTMAILWQQSNQINIQAVWNRSIKASKNLQERLPHIKICTSIHKMPPADIIVIGVSDHIITSVAEKVWQNNWIKSETLLIHFSGALSSKILLPKKQIALTGSMHPAFAFSHIDTAIKTLPGHLCALEGDESALPIMQQLAKLIGLETFLITTEQKTRYHAALSISANFLIALNAYARKILSSISIPPELANKLVNQLMLQNLNQVQQFTPEEALTGPIKRGDINTITEHWMALTEQEQILYQALTQETLKLTKLSANIQQQINNVVANANKITK